jgi:hypothetical protein
MIVIVGLVVLLAAVIVGFIGVLANAGPAHPLTENFAVLGYHVTGSTGTLFLFGIVIGAVAMLGLSVLLAGARRTAGRGRNARRELKSSQRETALLNHDRDRLLENQRPVSAAPGSTMAATPRRRSPLLGRFSRYRQPVSTTRSGITENDGIRDER